MSRPRDPLKDAIANLKHEIANLSAQLSTSLEKRDLRATIHAKREELQALILMQRRQERRVVTREIISARQHQTAADDLILPKWLPVVDVMDPVLEIAEDASFTPDQIQQFETQLRTLSKYAYFTRNNFFPKLDLNPSWLLKYNRILLHAIPLSVFIVYHQFFNYYAGDTIVSVGSGFGHIERLFSPFWTAPHIYLVDPAPYSFLPSERVGGWDSNKQTQGEKLLGPGLGIGGWLPSYAYVADLVTDRPEVVGQNGLFLMWPDPGYHYDVAAILALQPRTILICYDLGGVAGSEELIEMEWAADYQLIAEFESIDIHEYLKDPHLILHNRLALWVRTDIPLLPQHPDSGTYYDMLDLQKLQQVSPRRRFIIREQIRI